MNGRDDERAELLDGALARIQSRQTPVRDSLAGHPEQQAELLPLLETAERAHSLLIPDGPAPKFVAAAEARLVRRIRESERKDRIAAQAHPFSAFLARIPAAAAALAAAAIVLLGTGWGVSAASAQALPGDPLYSVKRGLEETSLALSFTDTGDVALLAQFADKRIAEIEQLAGEGRPADLDTGLGEYEQVLIRLDAAVAKLPAQSNAVQLDNIQMQLERHAGVLAALRDKLPEQAQGAIDRVIERSKKSKDLIEQLQGSQGPDNLPPGQEKKTVTDEKQPSNPEATKTPKPTNTDKPSKTPALTKTDEPTKTPKPTNTDKPTKTDKPEKTDEPTDPPKPTKVDKPTDPPKPTKEK